MDVSPTGIRIRFCVLHHRSSFFYTGREFFIFRIPFCVHETVVPLRKRADAWRYLWGPGEHHDVDPGIMRLVWLVVTLLSPGTGIVVYIAAWIIIPQSPGESPGQTPATS